MAFYDRETLSQLAAAPPVRHFLRQHQLVRAPGLNLFDSARLQAGRESNWDAMAQASDADRETYKQLLRGLATTSGLRRGPQFEQAINAGSQHIRQLAPYLMTTHPALWDQLHGNRGSAASLASAVSQAHPDRTALENAGTAQTIFKQMPEGGLAARDLGEVYKTMVGQGLLGQKGGIEANEASKRVLHVGSGIRGLIDANREFPKLAMSRWRKPDALAALLPRSSGYSRALNLSTAKAKLGLGTELPGLAGLAGELNYKPGYIPALHKRLRVTGEGPNVLYRGSHLLDPWASNTSSKLQPASRVVLGTPDITNATYYGASAGPLGTVVSSHQSQPSQMFSPDFTHGQWGAPFSAYVRQARDGAATTSAAVAKTFGVPPPHIVANPAAQENAYETAMHPSFNPVTRRLLVSDQGVAAVPRTRRWENILRSVYAPSGSIGGQTPVAALPIQPPISAQTVKAAGILPRSFGQIRELLFPSKPDDKPVPPIAPATRLGWRRRPAGAAGVAYDAAPGPEPIHSAVAPGGRWLGFRDYTMPERFRHFQTDEVVGPPAPMMTPPVKPQALLRMQNPMFQDKQADLKPGVVLQPHQQRIADEATHARETGQPYKKLLLWQLGSGKSLGALAAAEALGEPYTAVVPASLRNNIRGEMSKFTDQKTPTDVMSYTAMGGGQLPQHPETLLADEVQRLRNPDSAQSAEFSDNASRAKNLLMMSGTPLVNRPGDMAVPFNLLTGSQLTPDEFDARYTTVKTKYPSLLHRLTGYGGKKELAVNRPEELKEKLKGKIDYYDPGKPVVPTSSEDVHVEMSSEQARLYRGVFDQLPWYIRHKLRNEISLTDAELQRTVAFLTGPRQVSLSNYPYMRNKDPNMAFEQSAKLQEAMKRLQETFKDDRTKALIFSDFLDAGITPYAAGLAKAKIPHAVFHGGMSDVERKQAVEDYNLGKVRALLLGPSGTEGISTKGTSLVQLLSPSYQPVRPRQAIGRALRYDSHTHLPEDLQNVKIQRFFSRLPKGWLDRTLSAVGFDRTEPTLAADDRLANISAAKEKLHEQFYDILKQIGEH